MNKTRAFLATVVVALLVAISGLFLWPAQATHPQVSGVAVCDEATGLSNITWTVTGDPAYPDVTATVVSQSLVTVPTFVGAELTGSEAAVATQNQVPAGTYTLEVGVQFDNHATGDIVYNSGSVTVDASCVEPTEEPTPTPTPTSTPTPTEPPEPTEPPTTEPPVTEPPVRAFEKCVGNTVVLVEQVWDNGEWVNTSTSYTTKQCHPEGQPPVIEEGM